MPAVPVALRKRTTGSAVGDLMVPPETVWDGLPAHQLTGDEYCLTDARAGYARMIREKDLNSVWNRYRPAPTLLYYLQRCGLGERM